MQWFDRWQRHQTPGKPRPQVRCSHVDRRRMRPRRPGRPCRRLPDRPALHQEQQPVEAPRRSRPSSRGFSVALDETGIVEPVAHTSYLINLGSPDDALWRKSIDAMTVEVERCGLLGIADLVVHPGSHMGAGRGSRAGAGRPGSRSSSPPHRGPGGHDRPGDDRRPGDVPGLSLRASAGYPPARGTPRASRRVRGYLPYFRGRLFPGDAGGVR